MTDLTASVDNLEPQDIDYLFDGPKQNAFDAIGHSPDDAARAVQLSQATGAPPNVVYGDLDNFERQTQAKLSAKIINDNRFVREFLTDPIAAKLTNDDLGNLDELSKAAEKYRSRDPILQTLKGFHEGYNESFGQMGGWIDQKDWQEHPKLAQYSAAIMLYPELFLRTGMGALGGIIGGAKSGATAVAKQFGADDNTADKFGRDIAGMTEQYVMGLTGVSKGPSPLEAVRHNIEIQTAIRSAEPWLKEGKIPPPGVDPTLDMVHTEQAKSDAEGLREMMKAMSATNLRERSPGYAKRFADQIVEGEIGLSADKVRELYGEKVPEEGDGKLGFIPDLQEKLRVAEATGSDVQVGLSDYLANVDPTVAKELEDHVRFREGGVTLEEAKNLETEEKPTVEQPTPVQVLRSAGGLNPLIKDRKLSLQREEPNFPEGFVVTKADPNAHNFNILDEKGKQVAYLDISEEAYGKRLYIDDIRGVKGFGPGDIGPRLMRDLLTQLKAEFPLAEELTGFRVSGARDKAGTYESHGKVSIKLDALGDEASLNALIDHIDREAAWEDVGGGYEAFFEPKENYSKNEQTLVDEVNRALNRIVPKQADVQEAQVVRSPRGDQLGGLHITSENVRPLIIWSLSADNPMRAARHEALHHLRQQGFFNREEWSTLMHAAMEEGWVEKYSIQEHYPNEKPAAQIEEAIAEAFGNWRRDQGEKGVLRKGLEKVLGEPAVTKVFEKLQKLLDTIKQGIDRVFGKDVGWEDLFERADSGVIGSREGNAPLGKNAFRESKEKQLELPQAGTTRMEDRDAFAQASAMGLTVPEYQKLMKLIEKRSQEDAEYLTKKYTEEARRRQSEKWKVDANAMRPEVVDAMKRDPTFATDLWFRDGELDGQKQTKPKFAKEFLTDEQKAQIPEHFQSDSGMHPDDIATLLGFQSGKELIDTMAAYDAALKASGKRPAEFRRQLIEQELSRQMEARYGKLQENVLQEAMEHVLSDTQIEMLHEETLGFATRAGLEFSIKKEEYLAALKDEFQNLPAKDVASTRFIADTGRANREAFRAAVSQDWAEAFRQKQRAYNATIFAKEALAFERKRDQLEKTADRFKPAQVKSVEQDYTNYIHGLLTQAGFKVRPRPDEIRAAIDFAGHGTLNDFYEHVRDAGWEPEISGDILTHGTKPAEQMSVAEFGAFKDAVDSLAHIGVAEKKLTLLGEQADFAEWKAGVLANIKSLPPRPRESQGRWLYKLDASLTRMEEIVKDLDLRQELGPLYNAIIVPMMKSKTKEFDLMTELSNHFRDTKGDFGKVWQKTLKDTIPQDFLIDPYTNSPFDLTRENLVNVMLNWGNSSNIMKLSQGYASLELGRKATREEATAFSQKLKQLIDQHATKQDWDFVQRMWEPFKKWQGEADTVARNTSGVAPRWIKPEPIDTPHGQIEGGYWPVKYDRLGSNLSLVEDKEGPTALLRKDYFRAATAKSHLKERTGYIDAVDIVSSIEQAAGVMQQSIHDIAYRDSIIQVGKVFYDKEIRGAIRKYYGKEYEDQLIPWLRRIANKNVADEQALKFWNDWQRRVRVNLIGHALPLNLKVIGSPDIGVPNPITWTSFEANRTENVKLAMEKSQEIRHLVYNMDRDFREQLERNITQKGYSSFQKEAVRWAFLPMMKTSQEFRMSTFVDKYQKALSEGKSEYESSVIADSYVRERHGAASVVDLPAIMESSETMKTLTMFYGYFNTMYNWQRQMPGNVRRGEWGNLNTNLWGSVLVGAGFGAALFNQTHEKDSWFKIMAKALVLQPLSTIPVVRDAANYALEGNNPRTPTAALITSIGAAATAGKNYYQHKQVKHPISTAANVVGIATGLPLLQLGRTGQFAADVYTRKQRPKNIIEWTRGIIGGESKLKP